MESLKSPRCITICVLVTLFCLGLLTGWTLGARYGSRSFSDRLTDLSTGLRAGPLEQEALGKMKTKMNLTDEQVEKIRPVIRSSIAEVIQLRKESLTKINACRKKGLEKLLPYLTPEQQEGVRHFITVKDEQLNEQLREN